MTSEPMRATVAEPQGGTREGVAAEGPEPAGALSAAGALSEAEWAEWAEGKEAAGKPATIGKRTVRTGAQRR